MPPFQAKTGGKNTNFMFFQQNKPHKNLNCANITKSLHSVYFLCICFRKIFFQRFQVRLSPYFSQNLGVKTLILWFFSSSMVPPKHIFAMMTQIIYAQIVYFVILSPISFYLGLYQLKIHDICIFTHSFEPNQGHKDPYDSFDENFRIADRSAIFTEQLLHNI